MFYVLQAKFLLFWWYAQNWKIFELKKKKKEKVGKKKM